MLRILCAALALALVWASAAGATITATSLAHYNSNGSAVTTSGAIAVGTAVATSESIVVVVYKHTTTSTISVADSQGNTYSSYTAQASGSTTVFQVFFCAAPAHALASTDTITVTFASTAEVMAFVSAKFTGVPAFAADKSSGALVTGAATNSAAISPAPTITPTNQNALALGFVYVTAAGTDGNITQPAGFSALATSTGTVGQGIIQWGWENLTSGPASQTYNPILAGTTSRTYYAGEGAFTTLANPFSCSIAMEGAGPC